MHHLRPKKLSTAFFLAAAREKISANFDANFFPLIFLRVKLNILRELMANAYDCTPRYICISLKLSKLVGRLAL